MKQSSTIFFKVRKCAQIYLPTFYAWYQIFLHKVEKLCMHKLGLPSQHTFCYVVSSRLLYECFHYLNRDECRESLVDISGIAHNGFFTMDRMELIEHERRSAIYARSDLRSTMKVLMKIDSYGGLLTGIFHIHPGRGPEAICPSCIDLNDQKRREYGGMKAIGAIFSRDAYVRFFSDKTKFNVSVIGKGVIQHDGYLYQLEDTRNL